MIIRPSANCDLEAIVALFTASVHQIAASSYSPAQLAAWAPVPPDLEQWRARLADLETLLSEREGQVSGFVSFTWAGHIELLFSAPAFSRRGVASGLYDAAVQKLLANGVAELSTEASTEARPFFASKGFKVAEEQVVERSGVQLKRFLMTVSLEGSAACLKSRAIPAKQRSDE